MADVEIREVERLAAQGDLLALQQLERNRCRIEQHCGCRLHLGDLCDSHLVRIDGLRTIETYDGTVEQNDWAPRAMVIIEVEAETREQLRERLVRLTDKLGLAKPLAFEVEDRHCPYCDAKPGDRCRTSSGAFSKDWHLARKNSAGFACNPTSDYYYDDDYTY